jgi:hypothetical protein
MQQSRSLAKSHTMGRCRPMTASRLLTLRISTDRSPSHAPRETFSAPQSYEVEPQSSGTLLPWADPYIADLQRRHEGELRRERIAGRERA